MSQYAKKLRQKLVYDFESLYYCEAELLPDLLRVSQEPNQQLANRAQQILRNLKQPATQEALCRMMIDSNNTLLTKLVLEAGYVPQGTALRALFYFLTQQWERYDGLDFDRRLLGLSYTLENEAVRRRIADSIRQSGRIELLEIIAGTQRGAQLNLLGESEWALMIEVMLQDSRYSELWELAQLAAPRYSFQILRQLATTTWQPSLADEQTAFERLKILVENCETAYPPANKLLKLQQTLHSSGTITKLAISPDSSLVAVSYNNNKVEVWEIATGNSLRVFEIEYDFVPYMSGLAFSPDSTKVACEVGNFVWLMNLTKGELEKTFEMSSDYGHDGKAVAFSPDGTRLSSISSEYVHTWNVASGELIHAGEAPHTSKYKLNRYYYILALSPSEKIAASVSRISGEVCLWNFQTGQTIGTLSNRQPTSNAFFSADGKQLLVAGYGSLKIWDITKKQLLGEMPLSKVDVNKNLFAFVTNGRLLLSTYNDVVCLWKFPEGKLSRVLDKTWGEINNLILSKHGDMLVSTSPGQIHIYISRLVQIAHLPIDKLSPNDLLWIEQIKHSQDISRIERQWLRFLIGLLGWHWRHEIELDEIDYVTASEFDIELEA